MKGQRREYGIKERRGKVESEDSGCVNVSVEITPQDSCPTINYTVDKELSSSSHLACHS